jgi:hypothetical protein
LKNELKELEKIENLIRKQKTKSARPKTLKGSKIKSKSTRNIIKFKTPSKSTVTTPSKSTRKGKTVRKSSSKSGLKGSKSSSRLRNRTLGQSKSARNIKNSYLKTFNRKNSSKKISQNSKTQKLNKQQKLDQSMEDEESQDLKVSPIVLEAIDLSKSSLMSEKSSSKSEISDHENDEEVTYINTGVQNMNTASQSSTISYNSKNEQNDVSQDEIREVELKIE